MARQRITAVIRDVESRVEHVEVLDDMPEGDPQEIVEKLVQQFNSSLRPNEPARELVRIESTGRSQEHCWVKTSIYMTETAQGDIYDTYRCEQCGATGRRYGCSGRPVLDPRFKRNPRYVASCPGKPE